MKTYSYIRSNMSTMDVTWRAPCACTKTVCSTVYNWSKLHHKDNSKIVFLYRLQVIIKSEIIDKLNN